MEEHVTSDEYTPNRQERLRAAKKQKEARNKITKNELWKAIEELRTAIGQQVRENRSLAVQLERDRTALAVLLSREPHDQTLIERAELEALDGLRRLVYTPQEGDSYSVALVEVELEDEDLEEYEDDADGEEE